MVSACDTALTDTLAGFGTCAGAVYAPEVVIVPLVELPPATPFTCQVTAVFVDPLTVAWKASGWPTTTVADVGVIETLTPLPVFPPPELELPPLPSPLQPATRTAAKHVKKRALPPRIPHLDENRSLFRLPCASGWCGKHVFHVTYGLPVPGDRLSRARG